MTLNKQQQALLNKSINHIHFKAIHARVQMDDNLEWSRNDNRPELPKYDKIKIERNKAGWCNFFLGTLKDLKP